MYGGSTTHISLKVNTSGVIPVIFASSILAFPVTIAGAFDGRWVASLQQLIFGMPLYKALVAARGIFAFRLPEGSGPWGLPVLGAMMIAAGLLSAWVPARRALAIAPADALRAE